MNTRTIKVTVTYDMTDPELIGAEITPREKVEEMVRNEMFDVFGWDEGYSGMSVEVIDE